MNEGFIDAKIDLEGSSFQVELADEEITTTLENEGEFSSEMNADEITVTVNADSYTCEMSVLGQYECETIANYDASGNKERDVNFYDYDGTLLHSYYASEFLLKNKMPSLPSRAGLVCEGWNWSLENARQQVLTCNKCDIGAIYNTIDGATKIKINLDVEELLSPCLNIAVNGTANIDWGDGTDEDITGTVSQYGSVEDNISTVHTYSQTGKYTISIKPEDDSVLHFYYDTTVGLITGNGTSNGYYRRTITNIFLGDNVNISQNGISYLSSVETVTIPKSARIESRNNSQFTRLSSLKHITIPNTITTIYSGFFNEDTSMQTVSLPETLTVIGSTAFYHNSSLKKLIAPYNLFSIGDSAFYTNINMETIYIGNAILHNSSFRGCSCFTEFTMSNTTTIPDRCFQNCSNLKLINLGNAITTISQFAFQYCSTIIKMVFPSTLTAIRSYAFAGCTSVIKYDFSNLTAIPSVYSNSFNDIASNCEIIVPDDLYEDWIVATNWSDLAEHIVKASEA